LTRDLATAGLEFPELMECGRGEKRKKLLYLKKKDKKEKKWEAVLVNNTTRTGIAVELW
jgi:hypothetical protein